MKYSKMTVLAGAVLLLASLGVPASAGADEGRGGRSFEAKLKGFEEVPAVSSTGRGEFRLRVSNDENSVEFELSYANLEGATTNAAHIHIGQKSVNGGVMAFLCGGGGRPPCTPTSGTFTGTITASDIMAVPAQGIAAGEFAEFLRAIRAGATYANVHTDKHPGGEIRGQIKGDDDDDDDDDDHDD
jgi:hypothetical protein